MMIMTMMMMNNNNEGDGWLMYATQRPAHVSPDASDEWLAQQVGSGHMRPHSPAGTFSAPQPVLPWQDARPPSSEFSERCLWLHIPYSLHAAQISSRHVVSAGHRTLICK